MTAWQHLLDVARDLFGGTQSAGSARHHNANSLREQVSAINTELAEVGAQLSATHAEIPSTDDVARTQENTLRARRSALLSQCNELIDALRRTDSADTDALLIGAMTGPGTSIVAMHRDRFASIQQSFRSL